MTQRPSQYLLRIAAFLLAIIGLAALLYEALIDAFLANPALNGLILGVLLIGIVFAIREVARLTPEVNWLDRAQRGDTRSYGRDPVILAPMARLVGERADKLRLTPPAMRSLLDGVASRLHESRELNRYAIGLLVFLGLLGTFWGLLTTIGAISSVVNSLDVDGGDIGAVFAELKAGLQAPLSGMSTAFSSSLFGLAGSLILGFVDLQAGQAQNRFYTDLEDWLSATIDMEPGLGSAIDGDGVPTAYLAALVEHNSENLSKLQEVVSHAEADRRRTNDALADLTNKLGTLTDQVAGEQQLLKKLSELQTEIAPLLISMNQAVADGRLGIDTESQGHLRDMNNNLARLIDDEAQGRVELLTGLRDEVRLLAKTVAHASQQAAEARGEGREQDTIDLPFKPDKDAPEKAKADADKPMADRPGMPDWLAPRQPNKEG